MKKSTVSSPSTRQASILVVEDEALVREVTCEVLKGAGFRVLQTETAREAKHILSRHRIDLLLCDCVLPDGDGLSIARDAIEQNGDVRVLVVSGYPTNKVERQLPANAQFMAKPFGSAALLAQVRDMLEDRKALSHVAGRG